MQLLGVTVLHVCSLLTTYAVVEALLPRTVTTQPCRLRVQGSLKQWQAQNRHSVDTFIYYGTWAVPHLVALGSDLHQGSNDFSLGKQAQEAEAGELLWEAVGCNRHTCALWDLQHHCWCDCMHLCMVVYV